MSNQKTAVSKAIARAPGHTQVCVWQGTLVGETHAPDFINWMEAEFGITVQYLEEILTMPDFDPEQGIIHGTGGRNDVFFAIKDGDEVKGSFITKRFGYGIRWVEDVLSVTNRGVNAAGKPTLYPEHVLEYKSWPEN
jgi:hypothetical protein